MSAERAVDGTLLVSKPVAQIVTFWRPGSGDWTWAEEYADVMTHERTAAIRERVETEGVAFVDSHAPVLLGSDGRVWDGHHRICIAIEKGIGSLMCEIAGDTADERTRP